MRTSLLVTCLALLAAASSGGAQESPVSTPAAPAPRLTDFVDSATLHGRLTRLPAERTERRIERVFVVEFDSVGRPQRVRPAVPHVMPPSYADSVGAMIMGSLRPIEPRRGGWSTYLLVDTGDLPRIEQVRLDTRWPSLANQGAVYRALQPFAEQMVNADTTLEGRSLTVRVSLRVRTDSLVEAPRVVHSSGLAAADSAALRVVPLIRVRPLLLDGEPVESSVVLPIVFAFPAPAEDS